MRELWPKLGLLPMNESDQDSALEAEYFLNELVLRDKDSNSLDDLDLS